MASVFTFVVNIYIDVPLADCFTNRKNAFIIARYRRWKIVIKKKRGLN